MLFSSVSPSALLWPLPRSVKQEDESHLLCRGGVVVYSRWILLLRVVLHGCVPAGYLMPNTFFMTIPGTEHQYMSCLPPLLQMLSILA